MRKLRRYANLLLVTLAFALLFCFPVFAKTVKYTVSEDVEFGGILINVRIEEFNSMGFSYGDSVNLRFSNGYRLKDIPYFNGYYGKVGDPVLVAYPGEPTLTFAECSTQDAWLGSGCKDGDTVKISLAKKGKYSAVQSAWDVAYSDNPADYASLENYCNFRAINVGNLATNRIYRGTSPADNRHNRASYTDDLLAKSNIAFVLNLADSEERMKGYMGGDDWKSDYTEKLYKAGCVECLGLTAAYRNPVFGEKLAAGLKGMMQHAGPYYIHCAEGKDRTGFVCLLLEALADASLEEVEADYMKSYDNFYGMNQQSDLEKYETVKYMRFDDMVDWFTDNHQLSLHEAACRYLMQYGFDEAGISQLRYCITK